MRVLDLRGEPCPYPFLRILRELFLSHEGSVLKVLGDCPESSEKIAKFASEEKFEIQLFEQKGAEWVVVLKKSRNSERLISLGKKFGWK
jgi:TusA-related sulfurtransferase